MKYMAGNPLELRSLKESYYIDQCCCSILQELKHREFRQVKYVFFSDFCCELLDYDDGRCLILITYNLEENVDER